MEHFYPPGPAAVPQNLTAASAAYKRHAWVAMLGLTVFIVLYFALSAWFAWTAWRLFSGMFGPDGGFELLGFVAAVCAAFLAVFMLKALFFVQHRYTIEDIEITRADQPRLFDFVDRLADEAGAPHAHKIYLSPRVNAAVFYDLSLLNLILPSKKNLEIGLGLVNVLTLGELKAVLAHEFGHFAQRSMAVGRWVYISQQIAGHVVARRDALDGFLRQLSRLDLRIAWVGWILSLIVWSIRSLMDVLFRLVLLAQRALSRQMEFQADLVAVSLTGSDALIHALHKLNAADDAWDRALSFASTEANSKRGINDLFAVQTRIIERMREILDQPDYGVVPVVPDSAPDSHRVFKTELAQPPRMWASHPPNSDREQNAKRHYVAAAVDERSAWDLFSDSQKLKEQMSAHVFRSTEVEPVPMQTTLERLESEYGRAYLDRAYRGTYLGRSPVRRAHTVADLYGPPLPAADIVQGLATLYPESLAVTIERLNEKQEEKHALEALRDQVAQPPGGVIRHNGVELRRAELPRVIAALEQELTAIRTEVEAHDQRCRSAHLAAARELQKGWPEYLQGLAALLHYADHSRANLSDAQGYCSNIYAVVTADGHVSSRELTRLMEGCQQLYAALEPVYSGAQQVSLDVTLARRLGVECWPAMLEELKLPPPTRDNISDWLSVIDSWVNGALGALQTLRGAALEELLIAEAQVAKHLHGASPVPEAPPAPTVPRDYRALLPGKERPRQKKLDLWDRFQTADGVLPGIARSAVAVGIVGSVVVLGAQVGMASLTIYNALSRPVWVEVADRKIEAPPLSPVSVSVPQSGTLKVRAMTRDNQEIEQFDVKLSGANSKYVYNVASAAPLYEWTAVYRRESQGKDPQQGLDSQQSQTEPGEHLLGAQRWATTQVEHMFEEPPQTIQMSGNADNYRHVLSAASTASPERQAELVPDEGERARLIAAHARWDPTTSSNIYMWLSLATKQPGFDALLAARLDQDAANVVLLRFEQDTTEGDRHAAVCTKHRARAQAAPTDPDLQYIAIRCGDDVRNDAEFLTAQQRWPDNSWFALAAGAVHAQRGEYKVAEPLYEKARRGLPAMRDYLSTDVARLRRLNSQVGEVSISDLVATAELAPLAAIESGSETAGTPLEAYHAMARGDLARAVELAKTANRGDDRIVRLIAFSDGATPAMISAAFELPDGEHLDFDDALVMYGLAVREQRDPAAYVTVIERLGKDTGKSALQFLAALARGVDPLQARASFPPTNLRARLAALDGAVIMLGRRAPQAWREEVTRGLFVGERGYLAVNK